MRSLVRMLVLLPLVVFAIPLGLLALVVYSWGPQRPKTVGIFHPYCSAGGGGERVLFCAVRSIPRDFRVVVYTGDADTAHIVQHCLDNFGPGSTPEQGRIQFVRLRLRFLVEAETWPRFTLIGQSLGSVLLGIEALFRAPTPTVFLDTMGYAFTYPAAWLVGSKVACYVHYPTISTDMLAKVSAKRNGSVTSNAAKYYYYLCFAALYRAVGHFAGLVMVNSTWTKNHIDSLWGIRSSLVFPPCLSEAAPARDIFARERVVVSLGQFRPEKNHELQLRAIHAYNAAHTDRLRLCMIGSCRHEQDEALVAALRVLAVRELGLEEGVDFEFLINCKRNVLEHKLATSLIGVHTMWNEHFGIGIVEMMHSGVLVVAHNSGGPKSDIITPHKDGLLAASVDEYAAAFHSLMALLPEERAAMQSRASESVKRFTEEGFAQAFASATSGVLF